MLKITREKAINMLVDYELDSLNSDELREVYADAVTNGTRGYNDFTDGNLAIQVELAFNETDGVRIVPTKNEGGISDAKLKSMVIDCFQLAPRFKFLGIYYYPMFMYDDLMDDFTPLEQAYMDRTNFDAHYDENFLLTGNNDVVIGLTNEEYTKHLRKHERTIVDYYTEFIK